MGEDERNCQETGARNTNLQFWVAFFFSFWNRNNATSLRLARPGRSLEDSTLLPLRFESAEG